MKIKSVIKLVGIAIISCGLAGALASCGSAAENGSGSSGSNTGFTIAVPSDTSNEARALLLLEEQGLITLREGADLSATKNDIVDNPYNIEIIEAEAASLPRTLEDVDMAVINGNYVLSSGMETSSALVGEDAGSQAAIEYANVIAVRAEDAQSEKTKVLVEALQSEEVKQYITDSYNGVVIPVDTNSADIKGSSSSGDKVIKVGASPAPHAEILEFAKSIVEKKGYTLEIVEFSDYVLPNIALNDGDIDANYFQHLPYLEDFNKENGFDLVSAAKIHFEPLSLYPGKTTSIEALKN